MRLDGRSARGVGSSVYLVERNTRQWAPLTPDAVVRFGGQRQPQQVVLNRSGFKRNRFRRDCTWLLTVSVTCYVRCGACTTTAARLLKEERKDMRVRLFFSFFATISTCSARHRISVVSHGICHCFSWFLMAFLCFLRLQKCFITSPCWDDYAPALMTNMKTGGLRVQSPRFTASVSHCGK